MTESTKQQGWKKYWKLANTNGQMSPISGQTNRPSHSGTGPEGTSHKNFSSNLPDVYMGHSNRIDRYAQYETMDMDSEINACLDILAEFSTQLNEQNNTPFEVSFKETPTDNEVEILKKQLQQWVKLNQLDQRAFKLFRNTLKYGDQTFVRDPETFEMYWTDMTKVMRVIVNESRGKEPEQYVIKDISPNFQNLTVAAKTTADYDTGASTGGSYTTTSGSQPGSSSRFSAAQNEVVVDAKHIVHLSLNEGLDFKWPFGQSILENVFKVYKQKELLEDAILIYRVARAPERRVFKIDVGNMAPHMAMAFVERVKNEIHQRRIPTANGGSGSIMDASYNPLCISLDTNIPLLDGRILPLSALIAEHKAGKENWAYSCDPVTGEVVPGVISWAGVTRSDAEVIKITFDNGETLTCTPDHKIPVFGKGFVEAKDLTPADSLIAFNTREMSLGGSAKKNTYQQVWDHSAKTWKWTHRIVGDFFRARQNHQEFTYLPENKDKPKAVIHHKNYDRYNNDPRNLVFMDKSDHVLFHSATKADFWKNAPAHIKNSVTSKISNTLKEHWAQLSADERAAKLWNIRQAQEKSVWARQHDPVVKASYKAAMSKSRKEYLKNNPDIKAKQIAALRNSDRYEFKNQRIKLTFEMLQEVANIVKGGLTNKTDAMRACSANPRLMELLRNENSNSGTANQCKIDFAHFGYSKVDRLISEHGYRNWKHFVKEIANFNHRIVSIERIANRDVGTLTIDREERWHAHHTFAIAAGIFIKNSIMEDYFFPQTADGRGSSVDILPGGDNLGQIDDLRYFNNKLCRGLRVPSSYLPSGPDDSERGVADGRMGTALIQEFRFNQYCERLQSLIVPKLDDEFKRFLSWRGFNIDSSLFELKFAPPQNFASYRQAELDAARVNNFTTMESLPYISKRFAMMRFLGLTEDEIMENEQQWREEHDESPAAEPAGTDLRSVGVVPGDIGSDIDMGDEFAADLEGGDDMGDPGAPMGAPGGAPPPPPPAGGPGAGLA